MRVLVVEDDAALRAFIGEAFAAAGHGAELAGDGDAGLRLASSGAYDCVVLDRMVPGPDGLSIVRAMRAMRVETPVLLLTALGAERERIAGFEAGADDYLVKPFSVGELLARAGALSRRPMLGRIATRMTVGDLVVDVNARTARLNDLTIPLQPREFDLLACLARHAGSVVTRTMLLEQVWRLTFDPRTNIVESHVSRLRAKLERAGRAPTIQTIRGEGYRLEAD